MKKHDQQVVLFALVIFSLRQIAPRGSQSLTIYLTAPQREQTSYAG